jgi:hypothetical protein
MENSILILDRLVEVVVQYKTFLLLFVAEFADQLNIVRTWLVDDGPRTVLNKIVHVGGGLARIAGF